MCERWRPGSIDGTLNSGATGVGVPWGQIAGWGGATLGAAVGLRLAQLEIRNPRVWAGAVWSIERRVRRQLARSMDSCNPDPLIVFAGSSSIRRWKSLPVDMAPLRTLNVGFGGALLPQVVHYASRLIIPWRPAGVVLYVGENDLARGILRRPDPVEAVIRELQEFLRALGSALPGTPIWCLALKRSWSRPGSWPAVDRANQQLAAWSDGEPDVEFIDTSRPLLAESGRPRRELFCLDGIHLNAAGYAVWTTVVRSRLLQRYGIGTTPAAAPLPVALPEAQPRS